MKRREIIKMLSIAPVAGGIIGSTMPFQTALGAVPSKKGKRDLITIEVMGGKNDSITLTVFMLKPDQDKVVGKRIQEELIKAKV